MLEDFHKISELLVTSYLGGNIFNVSSVLNMELAGTSKMSERVFMLKFYCGSRNLYILDQFSVCLKLESSIGNFMGIH